MVTFDSPRDYEMALGPRWGSAPGSPDLEGREMVFSSPVLVSHLLIRRASMAGQPAIDRRTEVHDEIEPEEQRAEAWVGATV